LIGGYGTSCPAEYWDRKAASKITGKKRAAALLQQHLNLLLEIWNESLGHHQTKSISVGSQLEQREVQIKPAFVS
jgi:hypothetical protein